MTRGGADPGADSTHPPLILRTRIPRLAAGQPLLAYLLQRFRYLDRAGWLAEIDAGRVFVDGRLARAEQPLRAGCELAYHKPHQEPRIDRNLRIVEANANFLVVDKPAHLPMHSDGPFVRNTLVHLLRSGDYPEAELVHRLDRETSGLCVVARTAAVRRALEVQFTKGTVAKAYLAVVRGLVAADFTVDAPIGHAPDSTIALRRSAAIGAREPSPARTDFTVVARGAQHTLLRCVPHTGRTHQIRVHLEHAGFPLVGDKLYGRPDADYLAFVARVKAGGDARDVATGEPDRQLLHAAELAFDEPETGVRRVFHSPLPAAFRAWLDRAP